MFSQTRSYRSGRKHNAAVAIEALEDRLLLSSTDIAEVPVWDGERFDQGQPFLNYFGGNGFRSENLHVSNDTVFSGQGAYRFALNIPQNSFDFFGISMAGFFKRDEIEYTDTRDITPYSDVVMQVKNETGAAFSLVFEIKDYRNLGSHRARWSTVISADSGWREIAVPLDLGASGWTIDGQPDLTRTRQFSFIVESNQEPVNGNLFFDELVMNERAGSLDPASAPANVLWRRMFERQFQALFGARDRDTGLLPSISAHNEVMGLNVTSAVVKTLPSAIDRGLVTSSEANQYVKLLVQNVNESMDDTLYLPPRNLDRVTLQANSKPEESSVDAAFLYLALYQYKHVPGTPAALRADIDAVLARFDFDAFATPHGWKQAYEIDKGVFTDQTYDGYSGEVFIISLAAHLAGQVDIADLYHSATLRENAHLTDPELEHLVHPDDRFRAPFLQWLFTMFVDVSDRGVDTYPNPALASNPLANAIRYQQDVNERFSELGRPLYLQRDASDDGSGNFYEQFSAYNDFGRPDVYMPWSNAFVTLAAPDVAEAALRHALVNELHGPFGFVDVVRWNTNSASPHLVGARNDLWNVALAMMAIDVHLNQSNRFLAELPAVKAALDRVFQTIITPIPNQTIDEGTTLQLTVQASDPLPPADRWTFSLGPGSPSGASIHSVTGRFTFTPTENQGPGKYTITVVATDNGSPSRTTNTTFDVSVREVNSPPILQAIADMAVFPGENLAFRARASDPDIPANILRYSFEGDIQPGMRLNASTGEFNWTPPANVALGRYELRIRVTDNGIPQQSDTESFAITVEEFTNLPPVLEPIEDTIAVVGEELTIPAQANDPDAPPQTLTYSLLGDVQPGMAFDPNTGILDWTPIAAQARHDYDLTVRITDNGSPSLFDEQSFTISVFIPPEQVEWTGPFHTTIDATPTLSWNPVPIDTGWVENHELLVYDKIMGRSVVSAQQSGSATDWTPSDAWPAALYQVFLRPVNAAGAGPWTVFDIDVAPPPFSPFTGPLEFINDTTPTFTWNPAAKSDRYEIFVYDVRAGQSVIDDGRGGPRSVDSESLTLQTELLAGREYSAHVRVVNDAGQASPFSKHVATIGDSPQANGQTRITGPLSQLDDATPTITWEEAQGSPDYELLLYDLHRGRLVHSETGISETEFTTGVLPAGVEYVVYVRPEGGDWSGHRFTIQHAAPRLSAPRIVQPDLGAPLTTTPVFVWRGSAGAVDYEIQLYDVVRGRRLYKLNTNGPRTWTPPRPLSPSRYQLFLRGINEFDEAGDWQGARFQVAFFSSQLPEHEAEFDRPEDIQPLEHFPNRTQLVFAAVKPAVESQPEPGSLAERADGESNGDAATAARQSHQTAPHWITTNADRRHSEQEVSPVRNSTTELDTVLAEWSDVEWWNEAGATDDDQGDAAEGAFLAAGTLAAGGLVLQELVRDQSAKSVCDRRRKSQISERTR